MKRTRILVADDHDVVRQGMRVLIESEWGLEICGEAATGREAVALAGELHPDVAVMDVGMPDLGGIEATRQIRQALPDTEVLVFTGHESEVIFHQVFAAGALGCVLKTDARQHLVPAIAALSRHKPYFGPGVSEVVFESYLRGGMLARDAAPDGISPREREIIQLLSEGLSNKEVATTLGISVKTAETHRATIMKKLGFKAFSELVRYAVRNGIVAP